MTFPEDNDILKVNVAEALVPVCPVVDIGTKAGKNFLFTAQTAVAGSKLLTYYRDISCLYICRCLKIMVC